jgi:hypothetical protein
MSPRLASQFVEKPALPRGAGSVVALRLGRFRRPRNGFWRRGDYSRCGVLTRAFEVACFSRRGGSSGLRDSDPRPNLGEVAAKKQPDSADVDICTNISGNSSEITRRS